MCNSFLKNEVDANPIILPQYILQLPVGQHILSQMKKRHTSLPIDLKSKLVTELSLQGTLGRCPSIFCVQNRGNEQYVDHLLKLFSSQPKKNTSITGEISTNSYYPMELKDITDTALTAPLQNLALPTRLEIPKDTNFNVSSDSLILSTNMATPMTSTNNAFSSRSSRYTYISLRANSKIPESLGIYYFEVRITLGLTDSIDIAIGFMSDDGKSSHVSDLRGHDDKSISWCGKDGRCLRYSHGKKEETNVAKFGEGDVVGLGVDFVRGVVWGTKNGVWLGDLVQINGFCEGGAGTTNKCLIPVVSLTQWCGIEVNFGMAGKDFEFNIGGYVSGIKAKVRKQVKRTKIETFRLPDGSKVNDEEGLSNVVDKLVLGYMKHRGFVNSLKAMEKDLGELGKDVICLKEEEEELCLLKKQIKRLIKDDLVDEVRKLMEDKFENFFNDNREVGFKLECLKLVIMLKKYEDVRKCLFFADDLKAKYPEEEFQKYIDEVAGLFAYDEPKDAISFKMMYGFEKIKIMDALIMGINERNNLSVLSPLDLIILRTDQNLETLASRNKKDVILIDMLKDYIKL